MKTMAVLAGVAFLTHQAPAQTVLFDFENAQVGSGLPLRLTVAGFSASFSSSGLGGFYIQQPQNTILFTPTGFSGNCLIPTAVYAADLHVGFSQTVTDFSILYAPQELACDSSARMRVTAYINGTFVGTSTTNASPGTWPSETLTFSLAEGFNSVVVHYDAPPPTGGDYGTIFVADNMSVTLAPVPPALHIACLTNQVQIAWPTNASGFTLQANTNLFYTNSWDSVTNAPEVNGDQNTVTLPVEAAPSFYRLKRP
jgi:hypothetical protein